MQLEENEEDSQTMTALVLNEDGTVSVGQTSGPPSDAACGLWQVGGIDFQMTLSRSFVTIPSAGLDPINMGGKMKTVCKPSPLFLPSTLRASMSA